MGKLKRFVLPRGITGIDITRSPNFAISPELYLDSPEINQTFCVAIKEVSDIQTLQSKKNPVLESGLDPTAYIGDDDL